MLLFVCFFFSILESFDVDEKQKIFSLIVSGLDIIASLPYYLVSDLWRINALQEIDSAVAENAAENVGETTMTPTFSPMSNYSSGQTYERTYGTTNLTADWWDYRKQYQGIGSPDGKFYEDYLLDSTIIWNKPYIR